MELRKKYWRKGSLAILLFLTVSLAYYTIVFQRLISLFVYPILVCNAKIIEPMSQWTFRGKEDSAQLSKRYATLKNKYEKLQNRHAELQATTAYFNGIKEIREFTNRYRHTGRISRVLARSFSDQGHFFLIDTGERDGIKKDMVVLCRNNVVGKISELYPWYSKVCLITDKLCKIGAYCGPNRAKGIHEGFNERAKTRLKFVDHLSKIAVGELVLTSGEGLIFPEGFALGRVSSVFREGLYQEVMIKPACDFKDIEYCTVQLRHS